MILPSLRAARVLLVASFLSTGPALAATPTAPVPIAGAQVHPLSPAAVQWLRVPGGFWLGNPQHAPGITVFLDPDCSICHEFYEQLQPLLRAHRVAVRILPVGVIRSTSPEKAAHLELPFVAHTGKTPQELLSQTESGFRNGPQGGHISPVSDPKALAIVQEHNRLLERLTAQYSGFPAGRLETPVIVATIDGRESVIFGAPPQGAAALVHALQR